MDPAYVDPAWSPLGPVDPPRWSPLRGLSYVDPAYVDPPTWIPHGWFAKRLFPKWCTHRNSVGAGF